MSMAIASNSKAPPVGPSIVERALHDLLPAYDEKGGRDFADSEDVSISQPVAVYRLLLGSLLETRSVAHAEQVGWRYVVKSDASRPGLVDLVGVENNHVEFGQLSQNEHSDAFVRALHFAQHEANKTTDLCEIRSLDMPSLHVAAIWVTSHPPAFIPYIMPRSFPSERLSVDREFVRKLVSAARAGTRKEPPLPTGTR